MITPPPFLSAAGVAGTVATAVPDWSCQQFKAADIIAKESQDLDRTEELKNGSTTLEHLQKGTKVKLVWKEYSLHLWPYRRHNNRLHYCGKQDLF